jgi:hypothetical protein
VHVSSCALANSLPTKAVLLTLPAPNNANAATHAPPHPPPNRYGSWGVCFTYAGWFGCAALGALGRSVADDDALARAAAFLVGKQRLDGGWGESYLSCQVGGWGVGVGVGGGGGM